MSSAERNTNWPSRRRDERLTADRYGPSRGSRYGAKSSGGNGGGSTSLGGNRRDDDNRSGGRYDWHRHRRGERDSTRRRRRSASRVSSASAASSSVESASSHPRRRRRDAESDEGTPTGRHRRHRAGRRSRSTSSDHGSSGNTGDGDPAERRGRRRTKLQPMELTECDAEEVMGEVEQAPGPMEPGQPPSSFYLPYLHPSSSTGTSTAVGNSAAGASMLSTELLLSLQQQLQQQPPERSGPVDATPNDIPSANASPTTGEGVGPEPANLIVAPARQLPSVEDFIPVLPKSLLSLVRGAPEVGTGGGNSNNPSPPPVAPGAGGGPDHPTAGAATEAEPSDAMVLIEAPKIAPDAERRARESRRAHISGFPHHVTQEELLDYFRLVLPEVRRLKTQREVRELALAAGDSEDDIREIPPLARTNIDEIRDLTLNIAKSKPFAFIEVSLADIITEMVAESEREHGRFSLQTADGRSIPITIRRPRDYEPLTGVDETKVVMIGFPSTLPEEKLRGAFEQFGEIEKFQVSEGLVYVEFTNAQDALDCRSDLHGQVLGNRMVIVLPLYDWLKCVCVKAGIDVTIDPEDPISGAAVLNAMRAAAIARTAGAGGSLGIGSETNAAGFLSDSGALVVSEKVNHMTNLLMMIMSLPDAILKLSHTYPHLRSLYGNAQVPIYATQILCLLNLFDEEELVLDNTYSQLIEDIEQEVESYGRVERLIVPRREARPRPPEVPKKENFGSHAEETAAMIDYEQAKKQFNLELDRYLARQNHPLYGGIGRVFVVYETVEEAAYAQQQIAGKLFGGRTVVTSFLFEDFLQEEDATKEDDGVVIDEEVEEVPSS